MINKINSDSILVEAKLYKTMKSCQNGSVVLHTSLLSNATNNLPKAMKICHGQLENISLHSVIIVLKHHSNHGILKIHYIIALM